MISNQNKNNLPHRIYYLIATFLLLSIVYNIFSQKKKKSFVYNITTLVEVIKKNKNMIIRDITQSIILYRIEWRKTIHVGTRGSRKDTTSCDYHHKSILSLRRGSARGQEERGQNASWKAEWRGWCLVRVKVGEEFQ